MPDDINEARHPYLEQYGNALVSNNYLRVTLVLVTLALVGAVGLGIATFAWAKTQKPLVVRIDPLGRPILSDYRDLTYAPQEIELRYFLAQFIRLRYSRMVSSVQESFGNSQYFLDDKLSQVLVNEERQSQSLAKFVREGTEETDVVIKNIALQDLRVNPMRATVDFEEVFYSRNDHLELRRERYAGYFEFVVRANVPNRFVLVNPLGLTITYFRRDAAFQ